jgi:hypothetical protein
MLPGFGELLGVSAAGWERLQALIGVAATLRRLSAELAARRCPR